MRPRGSRPHTAGRRRCHGADWPVRRWWPCPACRCHDQPDARRCSTGRPCRGGAPRRARRPLSERIRAARAKPAGGQPGPTSTASSSSRNRPGRPRTTWSPGPEADRREARRTRRHARSVRVRGAADLPRQSHPRGRVPSPRDQRYRATVCFGASSTTDDLEGELMPASGPAPSRAAVEEALAGFVGMMDQRRRSAQSRSAAAGPTRWRAPRDPNLARGG